MNKHVNNKKDQISMNDEFLDKSHYQLLVTDILR